MQLLKQICYNQDQQEKYKCDKPFKNNINNLFLQQVNEQERYNIKQIIISSMTQIICQYQNHENMNIVGFCLNEKCKKNTKFCLICYFTNHSNHIKDCYPFYKIKEQILHILYIWAELSVNYPNDLLAAYTNIIKQTMKYYVLFQVEDIKFLKLIYKNYQFAILQSDDFNLLNEFLNQLQINMNQLEKSILDDNERLLQYQFNDNDLNLERYCKFYVELLDQQKQATEILLEALESLFIVILVDTITEWITAKPQRLKELCEKSLQIDPYCEIAYQILINLNFIQCKLEKQDLLKALSLFPNNGIILLFTLKHQDLFPQDEIFSNNQLKLYYHLIKQTLFQEVDKQYDQDEYIYECTFNRTFNLKQLQYILKNSENDPISFQLFQNLQSSIGNNNYSQQKHKLIENRNVFLKLQFYMFLRINKNKKFVQMKIKIN